MSKTIKYLLIIAACLTLLRLYSISSLNFPFYPYIDTIYSKDFSWDKFRKISNGMSESEVVSIIGEPLSKTIQDNMNANDTCWQYTTDGKLWPYADFSYYQAQTCLSNGIVTNSTVYEFAN